MSDVNDLLNFYSSNLSEEFKRLARPLFDCFDLTDFAYSLSEPNGGFFQISNNPEVGHFYFGNRLYQFNPFICHPQNYKNNQVIITSDFPHRSFHRAQKLVKDQYGLENFLILYKREQDLAHIFMFSSRLENVPLNTIFISNLPTLIRFVEYFLNEWKPYQSRMDSFKINLGELLGPSYFAMNPDIEKGSARQNRMQFLRKIGGLGRPEVQTDRLSPRELQCIGPFLKGKSAREIADHMDLSRRTVEQYLDNIKSKLGCISKSELFELLYDFHHMNLL